METWSELWVYWISWTRNKLFIVRTVLLKIFFILFVVLSFAHVDARGESLFFLTEVRDTIIHEDSISVGGKETLVVKEKIRNLKPHSPRKATIMAMILPGSAQIYNGQWWKVPILYGGIGATVYGLSWNMKYFRKYRTAFLDYTNYLDLKAVDPDIPYPTDNSWDKLMIAGSTAADFTPSQQQRMKDQLKNKKDYYKRNRDLLYIVSGAIYILQIIDATVFAHFYDYEINDDLSMSVRPSAGFSPVVGANVGISLTINF